MSPARRERCPNLVTVSVTHTASVRDHFNPQRGGIAAAVAHESAKKRGGGAKGFPKGSAKRGGASKAGRVRSAKGAAKKNGDHHRYESRFEFHTFETTEVFGTDSQH